MVLFQETQYLRSNPIVWVGLFSLILPTTLALGKSDFNAGFEGIKPLLTIGLVDCLILTLIFSAKLIVQINKEEIHYRWFPFQLKTQKIAWSNVASAEVRKYNPLSEYGGWGIKGWSSKNRAYNVDGNRGLQLVLNDGKRILIGSKLPQQLEVLLFDLKIQQVSNG